MAATKMNKILFFRVNFAAQLAVDSDLGDGSRAGKNLGFLEKVFRFLGFF